MMAVHVTLIMILILVLVALTVVITWLVTYCRKDLNWVVLISVVQLLVAFVLIFLLIWERLNVALAGLI